MQGCLRAPKGNAKMPKLTLLDPNKTGRQAEDLENQLRNLVVGQDEAIHQIVRAYQTHLAGLSPIRPADRKFRFLRPTGSGKTPIVEATAESLLKDSRSVIKIDCAEFQHCHEIATFCEPRGRIRWSYVWPRARNRAYVG